MTAEPFRPHAPWATAAWLVALAAIAAALVALAGNATRERAARNEAAQVLKLVQPLLPPGGHDNDPELDRIFIAAPEITGGGRPLPTYRARRQGEPAAVVMTVVARQGYVGPIRLLVALGAEGRVIAVRALAHQETPGLGDRIDAGKSDWMQAFTGRSPASLPAGHWAVRRDGGEFDQLTGATITSRAVVTAVGDAARYYKEHQAEIFQRPAE